MALSKIQSESMNLADDFAGMHFGGTGSANQFDDYETGDWSPEFADATSGGNVSSTTVNYAKYVKIGSFVHISVRFSDISTSGLTAGNLAYIRNIPFVANDQQAISAPWFQNVNTVSSTSTVIARMPSNTSHIRFEQLRDNNSDTSLKVQDFANGTADLQLTTTYTTDA